ncbi:MAG: TlyA family RNA methyltransferase [Lentisphaeria bacterium]|nr:TlyA family RNA methyltransferase [Lentisphaeria bacterium]
MKKYRADELLCLRGHCGSKEEAAILIMAGKVRTSPDAVVRKPSDMLSAETPLLVDSSCPYVSRGALKLKDALEKHAPDLTGCICGDVGASTGGFTDLMLSKNAAKVYAIDVGKGLLHWKLRTDKRVEVREGINAKELSKEIVPEELDVLVMDVSFISCTKILPAADTLMKKNALAFILVKPQFEAPKHLVPPGGVITDENVRQDCLKKVCDFVASNLPWELVDVSDSPLKGPKGNLEFVAHFMKK